MRDHQFLELLLNVLKKKDEQVEIIEEAAYTIANLARDCNYFIIKNLQNFLNIGKKIKLF